MTKVNGQECMELCFANETTHPAVRGEAVCGSMETMVSCSQRFLLHNKLVLIIGGGPYSKRHVWKAAEDFGVRVVLVDNDPDHFAKDQVHRFIHVDFADYTRDQENAGVIAKRVQTEIGRVDGCLTVWEDCVPLTSLVAERLNLPHTPSYVAAVAAKSKYLIHEILLENDGESTDGAKASKYASPVMQITGAHDVDDALRKIPLPAVLKFEFGSGSVGVRHVTTYSEVAEHVERIPRTLLKDDGIGHGDSMVLMPRLAGTEHDVEIVMFEGKVMAAFVVDMGPTPFPMCQQLIAALPSVLSDESHRQLITASEACCRSLGLNTGVFSVGMMLTSQGPKLIEINARMGGLFTRDFVSYIYDEDIFHLALMAACGVPPVSATKGLNVQVPEAPVGHADNRVILDSRGHIIGLGEELLEIEGLAIGRSTANSMTSDEPLDLKGLTNSHSSTSIKDYQGHEERRELSGLMNDHRRTCDREKQGHGNRVNHKDPLDREGYSTASDRENQGHARSIKVKVKCTKANHGQGQQLESDGYITKYVTENHVHTDSKNNTDSLDLEGLVKDYNTTTVRKNKGQLIGLLLYLGRHGNALATTATPEHLQRLHHQGSIIFCQHLKTLEKHPNEYEETFATLAVHAPTVEEARAKFISTCLGLRLETEETIEELLRDFVVQ